MLVKPIVYSKKDFVGLKKAGRLAAYVLDYIAQFIKEGITTLELNDLCHELIIKNNGIPATLGYNGYPKSTCISLNHVVCHGIPSKRKLVYGDILNIDVTVILDGWYGDTSRMYTVGTPPPEAAKLINAAFDAMMIGIGTVKPGAHIGDIGRAIQSYVESKNFSVVRDYCGHGIGKVFHDEPVVLHFKIKDAGILLKPGYVFTIEPMINTGGYKTALLSDGWTAVTVDRSLSAQFEHTIGVTEDGCEIFTISSD